LLAVQGEQTDNMPKNVQLKGYHQKLQSGRIILKGSNIFPESKQERSCSHLWLSYYGSQSIGYKTFTVISMNHIFVFIL
jgi:hypothetical protein